MDKTRVYSYLRFSDPKQAEGHSAERQIEYARRWAEENGAELDTTLTLRDEGLSAYHQRHVKSGALGAFLLAVDEGRIPSGSVLIVEGLDRLSRAEPIQAQAQLAQIINAGITVVTASDGKRYNRELLKAQPMDLVYSLLVMIRAHEESDTKSKRVSAAVRRQCKAWVDGTFRGIIRNGKDPAYLRWTGERFELIPERADLMRRMLELWVDGYGFASIMRKFKDEGADLSLVPTASSTVYKMAAGKFIAGIKEIDVDGEHFELHDYYPPLVDDELYSRIRAQNDTRRWKRGPTVTPGVVVGIGITFCGYCGSGMSQQNLWSTRRVQKNGLPYDGHRRTRCAHSADTCISGSASAAQIERAIFGYCSDQFRLDALLTPKFDPAQPIRAELAKARSEIAEKEAQLQRLTDALIEASTDAAPLAFIRKANELEANLAELRGKARQMEADLLRCSHREQPAAAKAWKDLMHGIENLDPDVRMTARKLVTDTFERIAIFVHGVNKAPARTAPIDVVLLTRTGNTRMLRINRRTGELIDASDFSGIAVDNDCARR